MKKRLIKIVATITVFIRINSLSREARLSIIQYSMQELLNPYKNICIMKQQKNT